MGMAAGQARLLSITARMSDNELRAQIINNDKMRLATESSQVSETYVQALNEAELMFANYDANNNASFQQLTFNSLTAYNPYNNQYALTNASGNILISEKDAKNYESAGGDMEKFLKCYGLEKTTTYFDKDNLNLDANGNVQFINPEILDTDGNYIPQSTGLTPEELKLAYLGLDTYKNLGGNLNSINLNGATGVVPQGYETTLNGVKYNDYMRYLDKYNQKYAEFQGSISAIMEKELDKIVKKYTNYDTLNKLKEALSQLNEDKHKNDISNIMTNLQKVISGSAFSSTATSSAGSNTVGSANNTTSYALADSDVENYFKTLWNRLNGNKGSNINYDLFTDNPIDPTVGGSVKEDNFELVYTSDGTNPTLSAIKIYDDDGTTLKEEISIGSNAYSTNSASPITVTIGGTQTKYLFSTSYDSANKIYTLNVTEVGANTIENMKSVTNNVIKSLKNALGNVWDPEKSTFTSQEPAATYYKDYVEAGRELFMVIYGGEKQLDGTIKYGINNTTWDPASSKTPALGELKYITLLYNSIGSSTYTDSKGNAHTGYPAFVHDDNNDFYQVYLNIVLENVQDTYGEPYFTWIDTSAPTGSYNENGEAKAQWYTNIWNMIEENGYKVLKDGLASSTEWIQFAFESGIVGMQQVDTNNVWNPLIYTNCSDITSQTSDKMIAKAEAEYNAAMNKIENKDKRYDLELKNIDTEHNSLQIEYESIKTAIEKNIERVFKLYS